MKILMTPAKSKMLLRLLASVRHIEGAICELGVYQGGSLKAMAEACPEKTCYGFDTFTGMPEEPWGATDFHKPGEFADTTYAEVVAAMPMNVILIRGLFPESFLSISSLGWAAGMNKVCFAHVDMDLEKSTEDAIEWLRPRMVSGGGIVFDDWHWQNCLGVTKAIEAAGLRVIESATNQCYWTAP